MPYLIDQLKQIGTPLDFKFIGRSDLITKPKKAGGTYQQYDYTFKLGDKIVTEGIFPKTHDLILSKAVEGDICRASVNGDFVKWEILPRGDAILNVPHPSNSASIKAEKEYGKHIDEQRVKNIQIALQGLIQAYIIAGNDNPIAEAEADLRKIMKRAHELAESEFPY